MLTALTKVDKMGGRRGECCKKGKFFWLQTGLKVIKLLMAVIY